MFLISEMTEVKLDWKALKSLPDTGKIYFTYSDIEKWPEWPEGPLVEIIAGELYIVPSPIVSHQDVLRRLLVILDKHVKSKKIGRIFSAPLDVVFSEKDVVDPDLFYISLSKEELIQVKNIQGAPDFIIEILSENRNRDLIEKKALYEKYGVREYWIVDPENLSVTVFLLDKTQKKYQKGLEFSSENELIGKVLPSLKLKVAEIFHD